MRTVTAMMVLALAGCATPFNYMVSVPADDPLADVLLKCAGVEHFEMTGEITISEKVSRSEAEALRDLFEKARSGGDVTERDLAKANCQ